MKKKSIVEIISALNPAELITVCERLTNEYCALAAIMGLNNQDDFAQNTIERCKNMIELDAPKYNQITLNEATTISFTCHGKSNYIPHLEELVLIDDKVKNGDTEGCIIGDGDTTYTTWRLV